MTTHAAILLVEDESSHATLIREGLKAAQLSNPLTIAEDGDQAVDHLQQLLDGGEPLPVLTLLDIHMPRRSGLEVLAWIRDRQELSGMPVIMLTSSELDEDIERAYALGANSYLIKPVGFTALVDVIRTVGLYWLVLNRPPGGQRS